MGRIDDAGAMFPKDETYSVVWRQWDYVTYQKVTRRVMHELRHYRKMDWYVLVSNIRTSPTQAYYANLTIPAKCDEPELSKHKAANTERLVRLVWK
jgi:hypothetical protein